jgi:hypothetical protein
MAFPVPICLRLGPAARLQVLEQLID